MRFIDANRDELGVEPICRDLQVAPSTYYAAKKRPLSARALLTRRHDPDRSCSLGTSQLQDLRGQKALEGGPACRPRHRPRAGGPPDGPSRHRRAAKGQASAARPGPIRPQSVTPTWSSARSAPSAPNRLSGLLRSDLCGHVVGLRLRLLHHRRLFPDDRWLAGGEPHASRHGPRRPRDGTLEAGHAPRRSHCALRRRLAIHLDALRRAPGRARCRSLHRIRRRLPLNRSMCNWQ